MPGIIDGHTHLVMLGAALKKIDMLGRSLQEVQQALKSVLAEDPKTPLLLGRSFLFDALGKPPNRRDLDVVAPDTPVFIDSADLHSSWLNTKAIELLGITKDTPDPKGGSFQKDENGDLTGLFLETATAEYVWPYLASKVTLDDRLRYLDAVFEQYLATGVTGGVEMALEEQDLEAVIAYYDQHDNKLPIRIAAHWLISPSGTAEERIGRVQEAMKQKTRLEYMAPWFRIAGIKIIADGVVDSCTAYCSKPYFDGSLAKPIWPKDELQEVVTMADKGGLQVAVHAIGDAAVDMALDVFEEAFRVNGDMDRRHRIEHLEVVNRDSIERLTRLGIVASLQPVHADPIYVPNWRKMLNEDERCDRAFPWADYVEAGSHMAFGSDAPTAPHHCFPNIYTATTRQSGVSSLLPPSDDPRIKALSKFCVGLDRAIENYTLGSAFSCRAEEYSGSLEVGKSADFCVLSIDPFKDGLETLKEAQEAVVETWVAGKLVWSKKA